MLRRRALRDRDETDALEAQGADGLLLGATQVSTQVVGRSEGRVVAGGGRVQFNVWVVEAGVGRRLAMARDVDLDESQYTQD